MSLAWPTFAAILAMAIATYLTRIAGVWLIARLRIAGRLQAALEAMPAAILTAVIAPTVLATGPAEFLAGVIAILAALRLPLLAVVAVGVAAVVVLRLIFAQG
jgi:uncharacterized membrane protein